MILNNNSDILYCRGDKTQTIKGWTPLAYGFQAKELADRSSGYLKLHPTMLPELSQLRMLFDKPLQVNSCCRTPSHNADEKGHPRSLHLTTNPVHPTLGSMAIDFNVSGWSKNDLENLIDTAWGRGWSIGHGYKVQDKECVDGSFLHLDRRLDIGLTRTEFYYG